MHKIDTQRTIQKLTCKKDKKDIKRYIKLSHVSYFKLRNTNNATT